MYWTQARSVTIFRGYWHGVNEIFINYQEITVNHGNTRKKSFIKMFSTDDFEIEFTSNFIL